VTVFVVLLACASPPPADARGAWMREVQLAADQPWIARDPALLEGKYAAMASDPFDFYRGSAAWFWADLARPGERPATAFLTDPRAAEVLIFGDAHPENVGSCLAWDGPGPSELDWMTTPFQATAEVIDLDGAVHGPWILDLRRAALGLAMSVSASPVCDVACRDRAVEALARGYAATISSIEGDDAAVRPPDGLIVGDMLLEAADEGLRFERYHDLVREDDVAPRFVTDAELDARGAGYLRLTADEDRQVVRLVRAWRERLAFAPRVHDAVRRYGAGVASRPAVRYYVLFDRGADGSQDDEIVQIREVIDPPAAPWVTAAPFESDAGRLETVSRTLWSRPDADPRALGLLDGDQAFKVSTVGSWFQDLDHEDLALELDEDDWRPEHVAELGAVIGRLLAEGHARGSTPSGEPALPILSAELDDPEALVAELLATSEADRARTLEDHQLFLELLDRFGPRLGAEWRREDVR
jgi:uncharacterized protein (DUF2252 family)